MRPIPDQSSQAQRTGPATDAGRVQVAEGRLHARHTGEDWGPVLMRMSSRSDIDYLAREGGSDVPTTWATVDRP